MDTLKIASALFAAFAIAPAVGAQTVALPLKAEDLNSGERYSTVVHKAVGVQTVGKDINGRRHLKDDRWSYHTAAYDNATTKPAKQNGHFVIYNKPFYAMASGVVIACWRRAPDNTPGTLHPWYVLALMAGGGNHLWIQQDDGNIALYAHAAKDSIDPAICPNNKEGFDNPTSKTYKNPDIDPNTAVPVDKQVRVSKGQFLGRVGNSGASADGPHLHVHLEKAGKAVAMTLERGLYQEIVGGKVDLNGKWLSMSGQAWPEKEIIFWPPRAVGSKLTWNNIPSKDFQRYFDHFANSGYMANTLACKQNGASVYIDSTWVPAKMPWLGYPLLSATEYTARRQNAQAQGFEETAHYACNTSYGQRNSAVFRKQ